MSARKTLAALLASTALILGAAAATATATTTVADSSWGRVAPTEDPQPTPEPGPVDAVAMDSSWG